MRDPRKSSGDTNELGKISMGKTFYPILFETVSAFKKPLSVFTNSHCHLVQVWGCRGQAGFGGWAHPNLSPRRDVFLPLSLMF